MRLPSSPLFLYLLAKKIVCVVFAAAFHSRIPNPDLRSFIHWFHRTRWRHYWNSVIPTRRTISNSIMKANQKKNRRREANVCGKVMRLHCSYSNSFLACGRGVGAVEEGTYFTKHTYIQKEKRILIDAEFQDSSLSVCKVLHRTLKELLHADNFPTI